MVSRLLNKQQKSNNIRLKFEPKIIFTSNVNEIKIVFSGCGYDDDDDGVLLGHT